jgi:cobyrinic acid a,c-diamide synthase
VKNKSYLKLETKDMSRYNLLIGATSSGCGKTTFTMGLLMALRERGLKVQPFKCGPDYIDTKFHERVCGRPSINLDTFMATPEHVHELFLRYGYDADICVVEGMMGLFDGYDRDHGSSAEIARVLDIPVVLVVDAKSAAYSTAALLQGFVHFREDIRVAGVVFNRVGSERHRQMLQQVCDDLRITCFGYLPKTQALEQGSRYLGLDFSEETSVSELMTMVEEHVDIEKLLSVISRQSVGSVASVESINPIDSNLSILVARNAESFSFMYQENLDRYRKIAFFDPETEVPQFEGIDLLYLPGGYPEKHLEALVSNEACRKAIKDFAERGGRIIAECGGMMYLCQSIVTDEGEYPMCGVLPFVITARMADRKLSLGYRRFELDGREYRGHEFHYTRFAEVTPSSATQVFDAKGNAVDTPVFRYKNVLASYTHLYNV